MTVVPSEDLIALTGRKRASAQAGVLTALKIPHARRPDGTILLFRESVIKVLTPNVAAATLETDRSHLSKAFNRSIK